MSHPLTPLGHHFLFRFTLAVSLLAGCALGVSAATFAPTSEELASSANRSTEAPLNFSALEVQVDSTGRSSYLLDDRRYLVDAVAVDSALVGNLWPGGRVYYQFASTVSTANRATWRNAAAGWSAVAGVTFTESTGTGNYIYVQTSSGNNSYVGMIGGSQEMNILDWLGYVIMHEIGHALGMEHEHSRSDRDSYVAIFLNNVVAGQTDNFQWNPNTVNYGAYDFESIMHYSRLAFSRNGQNTIEPRPAYASHLYTMGMSQSLSASDRSGMAQRYPRPPANDMFANRLALSGGHGLIVGSNAGATREVGEPSHSGYSFGSAWYTWVAPSTTQLLLDSSGSEFGVALGIYKGTSVSQLTRVPLTEAEGGVIFSAIAGTSYQIAVDTHVQGGGNYRIAWGTTRRSDFNRDLSPDLVWENKTTGQRTIWSMDGVTRVGSSALPTVPPQWEIVGTGDFDYDFQPDLVWQNRITGQRGIWLMNGSESRGSLALPTVSPQWEIAGTGDFNLDGRADLILQNKSTGQRLVWVMFYGQKLGDILLPTVGPQWRIAAAGDFNGDKSADLVWENTNTGQRSIWFLHGTTRIGDAILPTVAPSWQIAGVGDFNSDGQTDLIWQNTVDGHRSIWFMNGTSVVGTAVLPNVSPEWQIRNH